MIRGKPTLFEGTKEIFYSTDNFRIRNYLNTAIGLPKNRLQLPTNRLNGGTENLVGENLVCENLSCENLVAENLVYGKFSVWKI